MTENSLMSDIVMLIWEIKINNDKIIIASQVMKIYVLGVRMFACLSIIKEKSKLENYNFKIFEIQMD